MKKPVKVEEVVGVGCMVVLVVITLGNVLTRYFTDMSFAWTEEISIFLIVVMTLAGAAAIAARDAHIRIEFFYDRGSPERRRVLRLVTTVTTVMLFTLLAVLFAVTLADEVKYAETSMGLGVPRWWFTAIVPPLCAVIAWRAGAAGLRRWRHPEADDGNAGDAGDETHAADAPGNKV